MLLYDSKNCQPHVHSESVTLPYIHYFFCFIMSSVIFMISISFRHYFVRIGLFLNLGTQSNDQVWVSQILFEKNMGPLKKIKENMV